MRPSGPGGSRYSSRACAPVVKDKSIMDSKHGPSLGGELILDQETIDSLIELGGGDDASLLLELIDLFLDDAGMRMRLIAEAGPTGDLETIEKMAHALKSASANIGALPFSSTCRALEANARDGHSQVVSELVSDLHSMYDEVGDALRTLKSSHAA